MFSVNGGGPGFYKITVSTPQLTAETANPTWALDEIIIKPSEYDAEKIEVVVTAGSGFYSLFYWEGDSKKEANFNVGDDVDTFLNRIRNLPNIRDYDPIVSLTTYDSAAVETTVPEEIATWKYLIELPKWRDQSVYMPSKNYDGLVDGGNGVSLSVSRIQEHSPPLSGSFAITVDGTPMEGNPFSYKAGGGIRGDLANYYSLPELNIDVMMGQDYEEEIHYFIEYVGRLGDPGLTIFDVSLMSGGKVGTSPTVTINRIREFSQTRPLYSPVPYEFLFTGSETPSLSLAVNNIPAVCEGLCAYQYNEAINPTLDTATTLSGATLTTGVLFPAARRRLIGESVDFPSEVTVSLSGVRCTGLAGTLDSFTCNFPTNGDSSVALPAGNEQPSVHIASLGYADASAVGNILVSMVVSGSSPSASAPGGGVEVTLTGSGFPLSMDSSLAISICGNEVTEILSVSNQQIVFVAPSEVTACGGGDGGLVSFNSQTATFSFAYDPSLAPQITSINPLHASPVLKTPLTISGPYDAAKTYRVFLYQDGMKKYECNVNSVATT